MTTILFENILKYLIKDLVYIITQYLAFTGYKEVISTDIPYHRNFYFNLVLSPNNRLAAYASKNIVKLFDLHTNTLLKTIVSFHRIDGINFVGNTSLVYVSTDGIVTKYDLENDIEDVTMILKENLHNNKDISLILLDADDTVEKPYINNDFIRTGNYAVVMPTSTNTSTNTNTSSSVNIILSDMSYDIVINNKKYELQDPNYGTTEGIYIDRNNNLLVLRVEEGGTGWNINYYSEIQIIDIKNFNIIHKFGFNTSSRYIIILKNNDIVAVDSLENITVWRNYKLLYTLVGHTDMIISIVELDSHNKDDILLVSASHDNTLRFWKNYTLVKTVDIGSLIVHMLVLSSNNMLILLCITSHNELIIYY